MPEILALRVELCCWCCSCDLGVHMRHLPCACHGCGCCLQAVPVGRCVVVHKGEVFSVWCFCLVAHTFRIVMLKACVFCLSVCVRACMCVHVWMRTLFVNECVCACVSACMCACACMHVCVLVCACVSVCMCECMHMCVCAVFVFFFPIPVSCTLGETRAPSCSWKQRNCHCFLSVLGSSCLSSGTSGLSSSCLSACFSFPGLFTCVFQKLLSSLWNTGNCPACLKVNPPLLDRAEQPSTCLWSIGALYKCCRLEFSFLLKNLFLLLTILIVSICTSFVFFCFHIQVTLGSVLLSVMIMWPTSHLSSQSSCIANILM